MTVEFPAVISVLARKTHISQRIALSIKMILAMWFCIAEKIGNMSQLLKCLVGCSCLGISLLVLR